MENVEKEYLEEATTVPISFSKNTNRGLSRDEMNLAEFPLTVLSKRVDPKVKTLEFQDQIINKSGKPVKRLWTITGADKFGLPTSSDDEVLLGLLKLTVDHQLEERKVFFTRYELLKILRWTTEGRSYSRLQNALDRLSGVRIKATNAFFDNDSKTHSTKNFGIIDAYEINDGRDNQTKPSYFIWSEELFKSFQVGFIKKLDLDLFLSLNSAVTKRLYRYLDKHFWYKSKIQMNLFMLAHEKIGVSRNYKFSSSIRQQIDPALEELISIGFVEKFEYLGRGKNLEIAIYAGRNKPRSQVAQQCDSDKLNYQQNSKDYRQQNSEYNRNQNNYDSVDHIARTAGNDQLSANLSSSRAEARELVQECLQSLVQRGLQQNVCHKLLQTKDTDELVRIKKIIKHFDSLCINNSPSISKNPMGFLYRAVEKPQRFVLPGEKNETAKSEVADIQQKIKSSLNSTRLKNAKNAQAQADLQELYRDFKKSELQKIKDEIEPYVFQKLQEEVVLGLKKIKGLISEERFNQSIDHGIDQKLERLFVLPTFDEWQHGLKDD
jgi:hypothetical protein